jgi:hypothetical protein
MNGADNKCKMVSEVEEGNASVEEWWGVDEREKQKYSFKKKLRRTMSIKPFYFQLRTAQNKIQTPELQSATLYFYRNPFFPFVWAF